MRHSLVYWATDAFSRRFVGQWRSPSTFWAIDTFHDLHWINVTNKNPQRQPTASTQHQNASCRTEPLHLRHRTETPTHFAAFRGMVSPDMETAQLCSQVNIVQHALLPLPNVRSQKKIPGQTDIRAHSAGGSDGHLFNSTECEQTSRKFVLISSGAARQQRTLGIIISEAGEHSEKCICADAGIASCDHK